MTQHAELIERLETSADLMPPDTAITMKYKAAAAAIKEQAAEIERLSKDAERYAWLRDKAQYHGGTRPVAWLTRSNGDGTPDSHLTWLDYEDLDEAIDEAMKGQP